MAASNFDLRFCPVASVDERYVIARDGVLVGGQGYVFVGEGVAVAPLLRQLEERMTAFEVVRRWSRSMPAAQAHQVLLWAATEDLVCTTAPS